MSVDTGFDLNPYTTASASSTLAPIDLSAKGLGIVHYDAMKALDQDASTAWVEGVKGPRIGERLTWTFTQLLTVTQLDMVTGYGYEGDAIFLENNRLRRARLEFSDGSTQEVEFPDENGEHTVSIARKVTSSINIVIEDVYPGSRFDDTPIDEVHIWGYRPKNPSQ